MTTGILETVDSSPFGKLLRCLCYFLFWKIFRLLSTRGIFPKIERSEKFSDIIRRNSVSKKGMVHAQPSNSLSPSIVPPTGWNISCRTMRRDERRDNDWNRLIFASPRRVHWRERYDRARYAVGKQESGLWKGSRHVRNGATGENTRPAARDAINDEIISTNCEASRPTFSRTVPRVETAISPPSFRPLHERISRSRGFERRPFSKRGGGGNWTRAFRNWRIFERWSLKRVWSAETL